MRQAQTLNEAQFRRVLHYCRSRRHSLRDTTIFMISFYAGLRAILRVPRKPNLMA